MKIGPYEVGEKIGAGGMGEVYRATDTRLGRTVALKILPESFAADPARMERFQREARVLASLNHPHIATLHGLEQDGDRHALVMEMVEGEDLSQRIARGPLPLAEALTIAVQVCRALEAAHQQGIIHRDLKPANVRLTPDETVKVLDFGLAKAVESESSAQTSFSHSPTMTRNATMAGMILGTAAYMSPEQARGKVVDTRTDVFSFGCVLFEMLAGEPAFKGEDLSEILASVIKGDVQWERLPRDLPAPVREAIERCLRMRPDERYQAIGDARIDVVAMLEHPERLHGIQPVRTSEARPSRLAAGLWAALGLAVGLAAGWALLGRSAPAPAAELLKFEIPIETPSRWWNQPEISPDGKSIAYLAPNGLGVRRMDQVEPRGIALPWGARQVAWSADSRTLVLSRRDVDELWRVPAEGGTPQLVAKLPDDGFLWGIAPLDAETMIVGMASGIFTVPLRGGTPERILAAEEGETLSAPFALPGGRGFLFGEAARGRIEVYDGKARKILVEIDGQRVFGPRYSRSGHLLFSSDTGQLGVFAVPFSLDRLELTGTPFRILPTGNFSVSDDDALAFLATTRADERLSQVVWVDREGKIAGTVGEPARGMSDPVLSPDDRRIAATAWLDPERSITGDIVVLDAVTGARYPLSDPLGSDYYPFWWAGGSQLGFVTFAPGIRQIKLGAADGSGERAIVDSAMVARTTRDGSFLLWSYPDSGLFYLEKGSSEIRQFMKDAADAFDLSPDHRVLAYVARDQPGILLRSFPDGSGLTAAFTGEAEEPTFSRDGRELYFWRDTTLMAVPIDTSGTTPTAGTARALFPAEPTRLRAKRRFDVGPDGRFLMVRFLDGDDAAVEASPRILAVRNWYLEYETRP